jgi:hypothetical protein
MRKPRTPEQAAAKVAYDKARRLADPEGWKAEYTARYRALTPEQRARRRERRAAWQRANPEKTREYQRRYRQKVGSRNAKAWRERNPEKVRDIYMRYHFGITQTAYDEMLAAQGGVCAICRRPETYRLPKTQAISRLVVDHDHETDEVRGLLCRACNSAIGHFQDDEERLLSAVEYLKVFRG